MDARFDICTECGGIDFALHHLEWERVCEDCGVVSPIELSLYDPPMERKTYSRPSYFKNTILANLVKKGAPINNEDSERLSCMFERSQALFKENKDYLQRKNYPSAQYVVWKLGLNIGLNLRPYVKLPKLKATLDKVEIDWKYLDPSNY